MTIDLIAVQSREVRFPVWEKLITQNKDLFERIIIVLTNDYVSGKDYSQEITSRMDFAHVFDIPQAEGDWRNIATNFALSDSHADYVLFMEQDFFVEDLSFIKDFKGDVLGVDDNGRIHPCFLLVKRELLDKTCKDFGAYPEEGTDHFFKVTEQLPAPEFLPPNKYFHMAGLTHNIRLENRGEAVIHKPEEYKLYKIMSKLL